MVISTKDEWDGRPPMGKASDDANNPTSKAYPGLKGAGAGFQDDRPGKRLSVLIWRGVLTNFAGYSLPRRQTRIGHSEQTFSPYPQSDDSEDEEDERERVAGN